MTIQFLICLLTLFFSLSSPALGENGVFGRSSLAAEETAVAGDGLSFTLQKLSNKLTDRLKGIQRILPVYLLMTSCELA